MIRCLRRPRAFAWRAEGLEHKGGSSGAYPHADAASVEFDRPLPVSPAVAASSVADRGSVYELIGATSLRLQIIGPGRDRSYARSPEACDGRSRQLTRSRITFRRLEKSSEGAAWIKTRVLHGNFDNQ